MDERERGQALMEAFNKFDDLLAVAQRALEDLMKIGA